MRDWCMDIGLVGEYSKACSIFSTREGDTDAIIGPTPTIETPSGPFIQGAAMHDVR